MDHSFIVFIFFTDFNFIFQIDGFKIAVTENEECDKCQHGKCRQQGSHVICDCYRDYTGVYCTELLKRPDNSTESTDEDGKVLQCRLY